jgi:uncharacterized protein YbjT (DUF2867 family)
LIHAAKGDQVNENPVLVLGATGLQGGEALKALLAAGVPVRALVRDAAQARPLADLGATLAAGSFEAESSLLAACQGARAIFSMQNAPQADPDSERRHARNIIKAARAAGVPHIVHTSVSGAGEYHRAVPGFAEGRWQTNYWNSKADVEDMVGSAGFAAFTILKPALMMENFTRPKADFLFPDLVDDALVTAMAPETRIAWVSGNDVGRATLAAVLDPARFNGASIELAGDNLTMSEAAATLSAATGRRIFARQASVEELLARGQSPGWVNTQEWLNVAGYPAAPADAGLYGLTPLTLAQWAERNAAAISR